MLRLHPRLAPYKVAVLPLSKKATLTPPAREVLRLLQPHFMSDYDETQAIGRRYRRQDEIGTPLVRHVDFDSLDDHAVTVRDRDTMEQDRVPVTSLVDHLRSKLASVGLPRQASAPTSDLPMDRMSSGEPNGRLMITSSTPAST